MSFIVSEEIELTWRWVTRAAVVTSKEWRPEHILRNPRQFSNSLSITLSRIRRLVSWGKAIPDDVSETEPEAFEP